MIFTTVLVSNVYSIQIKNKNTHGFLRQVVDVAGSKSMFSYGDPDLDPGKESVSGSATLLIKIG